MTLRFSPAMLALRSNIPEEMSFKVVSVLPCFKMSAPLAIVKLPLPFCVQLPRLGQTLPLTSMVTLLLLNAAEIILDASESIMRSMGSKSHKPDLPLVFVALGVADALVSTETFLPRTTLPLELVSIKPPLPPSAPPTALSIPLTVVLISDQITILPALPSCIADALTMAFSATVTVLAICLV
ncbi:hypothetical protein POBR111598_10075 [Polynucleobacter brandtiae]